MSRTAKDWQKAKQQAQHIRDTLHHLIEDLETLSWEHPDIIEETANKLKKTLNHKAIPLANQILGTLTITWAEEENTQPNHTYQNDGRILTICSVCNYKYSPQQNNQCPNTPNHPCKNCGHRKHNHIYGEGACRPGSVCPCKIYKETT